MKRFLLKLIYFFFVPLIVILLVVIPYVIADPYEDFKKKENYSWKYSFQQLGDLSTKKIINSKVEYNSFIMGSSSTVSVYACYLEKKIPNSKFFHYANWNERIGGIYQKLKLVDSLGLSIDNVILYFDTNCTFKGDGECRPSDHYLLTNTSKLDYLVGHFKLFFKNMTIDKFKIYLGQPVSEEVLRNWKSDILTNDAKHICSDSVISTYSNINNSKLYRDRIDSMINVKFLYERPLVQQYTKTQISENEKEILHQIHNLFIKHNTEYYVVLTPLYDQKKFNSTDINILNRLFINRVFDYSGINNITNNKYNYPDKKHFQPYISKNIIDSILNI